MHYRKQILIIRTTLRHSDTRQYEAANVLGASDWRQFLDITLPGLRYGLLSAAFVIFTITITDFGNAIVIGGNFSVLATEIYSQVSGQMKFGMGAVVGILLLLPAAASILDRTRNGQTAKSDWAHMRRSHTFHNRCARAICRSIWQR
nr:ABC transporter permease subunit [Pectobacterium colocasium]